MPTVINTNLASLFAQNSLSNAQNNLAQSVQRLSSGLRINSAKDDAAGLSISQNMQSQINGTNQSIRNLSDATNLLQVADSSLSTVQDMLLRLKQLATQGYDGSLSTSQKLNIVQEMKDLNNEINATAQRTAFNGINLLTTGSSIDLNNSDVKTGEQLITTAVTFTATTGIGRLVGSAKDTVSTATVGDTATSAALDKADAAAGSEVITKGTKITGIELDPELKSKLGGVTFTFTANGNNLTMTGTQDGLAKSQTVTIRDTRFDSQTSIIDTQALDFDQFGVKFNLSTETVANKATLGSRIATAFQTASTLAFGGVVGEITSTSLSGVAPGTYQFSKVITGAGLGTSYTGTVSGASTTAGTYSNIAFTTNGSGSGASLTVTTTGTLGTAGTAVLTGGSGYKVGDVITVGTGTLGAIGSTASFTVSALHADNQVVNLMMSGSVNGIAQTQYVALSNNAANATQTINFNNFGVSMDVKSYQAQTADQIATKFATLNNGTPAAAGQLVVGQGNNSALKFQSGANSDAFIQIDTLNIQTGSTGATAGSSTEMMTLGRRISQTGAGNLGTLGNLDTIDTWQTAFKNAAAAVDDALEFISTERAVYGSQMNRLSYVSTNLQAQSTNLQNSRSAIVDTDFAAETAKLTKGQIMQQAATAMLAQANQMPNVILSLLK
jgi:flagellin